MSSEEQQTLFGLFAPQPQATTSGHAGIPRVSPTEQRHPDTAARASYAASDKIVFERSARARQYRLTLRRDGTAVATIPARGSER